MDYKLSKIRIKNYLFRFILNLVGQIERVTQSLTDKKYEVLYFAIHDPHQPYT